MKPATELNRACAHVSVSRRSIGQRCGVTSKLTNDDRDKTLDAHNHYRAQQNAANMMKLVSYRRY